MVTIRMSRGGMKKRPFYQIVVTDSRSKRDGSFIERIGFFNPVSRGKEERLRLDMDRVNYWLGTGAQTSERVKQLIKVYQKQAPLAEAANEAAPEPVAEPVETAAAS